MITISPIKVSVNTKRFKRVCPKERMNKSINSFQLSGLPVNSLKFPKLTIMNRKNKRIVVIFINISNILNKRFPFTKMEIIPMLKSKDVK